jgi:hypothetical protein
MHALVTTVPLRSACLNPFVNNPKLHPAEGGFRKYHEPHAREWRAVVGPDSSGYSVLPHSCFTDRSNLAKVCARDDPATNQIMAIRIGYPKRMSVALMKSPESTSLPRSAAAPRQTDTAESASISPHCSSSPRHPPTEIVTPIPSEECLLNTILSTSPTVDAYRASNGLKEGLD